MPETSLQELTSVAQALLDESVSILATTDAGVPESYFITPARPAFDCEFLAVQVARIAEDSTSPNAPRETRKRKYFGNIIAVTFLIYVVRCAPVPMGMKPPTDIAKTLSAETVNQDAWALWNGIRVAQDTIFDACEGVYFEGGVPIPEQGGYVGWLFQIRATIEGYTPS